MIRKTHNRRGVTLAIVVMVLAALAGIFAFLSFTLVDAHKQSRVATLERAAQSAADSAALLVQSDPAAWIDRLAEGPQELNINDLIPAFATGGVHLRIVNDANQRVVHIHATVATAHLNASANRKVPLPL